MEAPAPSADEPQSDMMTSQPGMASNGNGHENSSAKRLEANRQKCAPLHRTANRRREGARAVQCRDARAARARDPPPRRGCGSLRGSRQTDATEAQPLGVEEDALVERMIACWWRLRRLIGVETGIVASEYSGILKKRARCEAKSYTPLRGQNRQDTVDEMLRRSRAQKRWHAAAPQALDSEQEIARRAEADTPTLGQAFVRGVRDADALSKRSRYEASIERSYYWALHELQRLQAGATRRARTAAARGGRDRDRRGRRLILRPHHPGWVARSREDTGREHGPGEGQPPATDLGTSRKPPESQRPQENQRDKEMTTARPQTENLRNKAKLDRPLATWLKRKTAGRLPPHAPRGWRRPMLPVINSLPSLPSFRASAASVLLVSRDWQRMGACTSLSRGEPRVVATGKCPIFGRPGGS